MPADFRFQDVAMMGAERDNDVRTWLVGLFGRGIGGSRSRQIHERAAAQLGLPLAYRAVDFERLGLQDDELGRMLTLAQGMDFTGLNITHPFKQTIIAHLDELTPDAQTLGAVNTVRFVDGRRVGHNTDWAGFAASLELHVGSALGTHVAQVGAGGAGSATAYALLKMGVEDVAIFDPDRDKAETLAMRLSDAFPGQRVSVCESAASAISGAAGVVQTSPIGMNGHPGLPFDPALLALGQWVADIIYFPLETQLVETARALGYNAFGGSAMVVHQAALAFEVFTGHAPDTERMLRDFHTQPVSPRSAE